MGSISHAIEFWLSVWRCVAVDRCEGSKNQVSGGTQEAKMIDSNMTKMDFPFSALDAGVTPHHFRHVYGPLEVCEQSGR